MYDAAISQVFMLCSHTAMGYDGQPSATAAVNGGTEDDQGITAVRVRVYWCKCLLLSRLLFWPDGMLQMPLFMKA